MTIAGACWTCGDRPPHRFRYLIHAKGRLRWAITTARHAQPKTLAARLRLLWHDFVIHGLLHRGGERCQDCGRDFPAWHADDADWRRVMGGPSGVLCASCFNRREKDGRRTTGSASAYVLPFRLSCSSCGGGIRWCEQRIANTGKKCCRHCDCAESIEGWETGRRSWS